MVPGELLVKISICFCRVSEDKIYVKTHLFLFRAVESHLAKIVFQFELFVNLFLKLKLAGVGKSL